MSVPCFENRARARWQPLALVLLAAVLLQPWPSLAASAEVVVDQAWVRAVPPNARTTAAYFVIHNKAEAPLIIRSVSADVAGAAELHQWVEHAGVKRMERQQQLTVPAGERLSLAPGALHMMLFRLDPVPAVGQQVRICLQADSGEHCFAAEVRRP